MLGKNNSMTQEGLQELQNKWGCLKLFIQNTMLNKYSKTGDSSAGKTFKLNTADDPQTVGRRCQLPEKAKIEIKRSI